MISMTAPSFDKYHPEPRATPTRDRAVATIASRFATTIPTRDQVRERARTLGLTLVGKTDAGFRLRDRASGELLEVECDDLLAVQERLSAIEQTRKRAKARARSNELLAAAWELQTLAAAFDLDPDELPALTDLQDQLVEVATIQHMTFPASSTSTAPPMNSRGSCHVSQPVGRRWMNC